MFDEKVRPFVQPAMFGYLAYFYTETSLESFSDQGELTSQMLGNINRYGMILAVLGALISLAIFIASWFEDPINKFSDQLRKSTNPLVMASMFQLLSIYVVGQSLGLPNFDTDEAVAAGVITIITALTSYSSTDNVSGEDSIRGKDGVFTKVLDLILGKQRSYNQLSTTVSGALILTAWSYNLASGAFVGPWYEAFTFMLLSVLSSLGLVLVAGKDNKIAQAAKSMRKGAAVVLHVLIIYFLSKYLGSEKTADNVVALGLVIASGVLSVASHNEKAADQSGRVRLNSKLNDWASLAVRVTHGAVAMLAVLALDDMSGDLVLHALVRIGAILKIGACFLPVCQLEFLMRNGSTLLLLLPSAALYDENAETLQMVAFALAVAARGVDAVQNSLVSESGALLDDLKKRAEALPPRGTFDNPMVYVVVVGLLTSSITLIFGGDEACADGILDPSAECSLTDRQSTSLRVTIALTWAHALLALVGSLVAMFERQRAQLGDETVKVLGYISLSTLELFRTAVSTTVLGLLAYVAHSATVGSPGDSQLATWLYISLFSYIFVDTLGRNVV